MNTYVLSNIKAFIKFIRVHLAVRWCIATFQKFMTFVTRSHNKNIIIVFNNNDSAIVPEIKARLCFYIPNASNCDLKFQKSIALKNLVRSDIILVCIKYAESNRLGLSLFENIFFIDHRHYIAGWEWVRLANYYLAHKADIFGAKSRLTDVINTRKDCYSRAYIFGTGPSLAKAMDNSFNDGYRIVCNTIVRDKDLFNKLRPDFIVAGDAVYHFSHTQFARAFRQDLLQRLKEVNTYFIYPAFFDVLVQRDFAEVSEKLIPIPIGMHDKLDINLLSKFELPALGNVLALLQLPVACTLSKNIYLWGFDGRSPYDNLNPFWANSQKHSYPELMDTLKTGFPFFFEFFVPNNNSKSYINSVHGDILGNRLSAAESRGYHFEMLHPSWTATLAKRYKGSITPDEYYGDTNNSNG